MRCSFRLPVHPRQCLLLSLVIIGLCGCFSVSLDLEAFKSCPGDSKPKKVMCLHDNTYIETCFPIDLANEMDRRDEKQEQKELSFVGQMN